MRPGRLVEVVMVDMEHDDFGWQPMATVRDRKPGRYRAVGYVVKDARRFLVIAPVVAQDQAAAFCAYRIPRAAVRSVRRLR